jgi:hypothetical protein
MLQKKHDEDGGYDDDGDEDYGYDEDNNDDYGDDGDECKCDGGVRLLSSPIGFRITINCSHWPMLKVFKFRICNGFISVHLIFFIQKSYAFIASM